jgi:carbonic anhydrase/acetyltransferase-like protein (isoleucine patch superfamily)
MTNINRKYEFTGETNQQYGVTLHRIRALRAFGVVNAGDIGGWIEKESNLSHEGTCWVFDNAQVYGNAQVLNNAHVFDNARVSGDARVYGSAQVFDNAHVSGDACVSGNAHVFDNARVYDNAQVSGNAQVFGSACVFDNARVYDNACVSGNAQVLNNACVAEYQRVQFGHLTVDITNNQNMIESIAAQTGIGSFGGKLIAYKHVREDLSSLHDKLFKYVVGEWAIAQDVDLSPTASCASGLHVSHRNYWNGKGGKKVLVCEVHIEDVVAVQEGKIRCKKLFVGGICDGMVF